MLLGVGAITTFECPSQNSFVHFAKDKKWVRLCTEYQVDMNIENHRGQTPLYEAITHDEKKAADVLIEAGADIHFICERDSSRNCLAKAVERCIKVTHDTHILKTLLDHKADPNVMGSWQILFDFAVRADKSIVKRVGDILFEAGIDINRQHGVCTNTFK